jgi:hypothetical protein
LSAKAVAAGLVLTSLAWYATTFVRYPTGFAVHYFPGADRTVPPAVTTLDDAVTTGLVRRTWPRLDEPFAVTWEAYLLLDRGGDVRFSVRSVGAARLVVDDRAVVDGDVPWRRQVTVPCRLESGVHALRLDYTSRAGSPDIELLWAASGMSRLAVLTGPYVSPRRPSRLHVVAVSVVDRARVALVALWTVGYLALVLRRLIAPLVSRLVRHHLPHGLPIPILGWLSATAVMYLVGLTWGVPGPGWAPHELVPGDLGIAVDSGFSRGWSSAYPPAHFYLCGLLAAPLLVWRWLDPLAYATSLAPDVLVVMFRLVSTAMAVGTVLMVYVCGTHLGSRWSAFVAAAIGGLSMPAMYYGKMANLDVPFVFWFSVSLGSFVRLATSDPSAVDGVVFALTAALAVCTKDQAYGLYVLPALALVAARPRQWRQSSAAAAVAAVTFVVCQNVIFNWTGFLAHVRFITSPGAAPFRMFGASLAGQWQLWRAVWSLIRLSLGWPAFLVCISGVALSLWRPPAEHRRLWWALLPAVSYGATFLAIIGFAYDRFLMPIFIPLALAGGVCAARLDRLRIRSAGRMAVSAVLAYSFAYVMAVNVALLHDPRYTVEAWIRAHVEPGATIGLVGPIEHVPRLDGWYTEPVDPTVDVIQSLGFEYLVVNADWAERFGPERLQGQGYRALREGRLKYRPVLEVHDPVGFAGLSLDRRLDPFRAAGLTTLTKLNPPTLVFKRQR